MRNKMAKLITPMESRPVNWVNNPTSSGPIPAAHLPKISKNPKYSFWLLYTSHFVQLAHCMVDLLYFGSKQGKRALSC